MSTENITGTTINRIRRRARRGETVEVHDLIQPGMSIRATGRRLSWYFRFSTAEVREDGKKERTARAICAVDACPDPVKMRAVVAAGCVALKEGSDPLTAVRSMLAQVLGMPETRVLDNPSVQTWNFNGFRQEFKRNPPSHLRPETIDGYYKAMSEAQIGKAVFSKRLVEVTAGDIRRIRDDIVQRGHVRQSVLTLTALRVAFEWAAETQRSALSGITEDNNPMLQVTAKRRSKRKPTPDDEIAAADLIKVDEHENIIVEDPNLMSMMDIGKLLILLLETTKLSLVKRAILILLVYSVQRRRTVAATLRKALVGFVQKGVAFWVLHGGTTKSGRPRILPFSMIALQIINSWKATSSGEIWLFPGMPTRRKPKPDGHVNVRTVNAWLDEACALAGCERRHNPHAIRKAFGSYLSKKKVSKADRKLILDHAEGRAGDVTEVHYNLDPKLPEKQQVMKIWNSFLDECIRVAKGESKANSSLEEALEGTELPGRAPEPPMRRPTQNADQEPTWQSASRAGELTAARLQKLRENLEARKKIDHSLERVLGTRTLVR